MSDDKHRRITLARRPTGMPTAADFETVEEAVPTPGEGEFLARVIYLSIDPYMRGRMDDARSYAAKVELGDTMVGGTVAEVVESRHPDFQAGDIVMGMFGWQSHAISDGREVAKLDPDLAPISTSLGVLGMPGLTAYVGLLDIGEPQAGETVVVSAASGAVGSMVGQIARIKGCRVVGVAGSPEKCAYVEKDLGFDACLSHRSDSLAEDLKKACPDGIDVYFENVSGKVFEAVLPNMNAFGRIPVCGLIANYNMTELPPGPDQLPRLMRAILVDRLKIQGFIVRDPQRWARRGDFLREAGPWVREGRIRYREDITDGLKNAPDVLRGVLSGKNFGKALVRVSDDPTR